MLSSLAAHLTHGGISSSGSFLLGAGIVIGKGTDKKRQRQNEITNKHTVKIVIFAIFEINIHLPIVPLGKNMSIVYGIKPKNMNFYITITLHKRKGNIV